MKTFVAIFTILSSLAGWSQSLIGAWQWTETDDNGREIKAVVTFTDGFQSVAWFDAETGAFIETNGGSWALDGNTMTEVPEFHTRDTSMIGKSASFEIEFDGNDKLRKVGQETWATRVDAGEPGDLAGAWLMSGRKRNGEIQERDTSRPRKTMKILSGTRFQWIAYNTETKQFMGTGGGTYSTVNGKYTENIEFFSRDDSRVGASLEFTYELKDGKWHHSGKSSKGDPLYEIWSVRN
ncbi:membrane or secreted protein [Ekhidna sp.]|uniref:membrane or secreted protein n=1 Tax=Ekhidna sp. TaxID=2608089 RepID=UPI003B503BC4